MPNAKTSYKAKVNAKAITTTKLLILLQMIVCVIGIYVCFAMWSLKQERIVKKPYTTSSTKEDGTISIKTEYFHTVFGISLLQSFAGIVVGMSLIILQTLLTWMLKLFTHMRQASLFATQKQQREKEVLHKENHSFRGKASKTSSSHINTTKAASSSSSFLSLSTVMSWYDVYLLFLVGFTNVFATSLAYAAMRRLSFPLVLTMKMSKMIPVMMVGFFYHHTRYPVRKILACLLITAGILTFYLLDESSYSQNAIHVNKDKHNTTFHVNTADNFYHNNVSNNDTMPSIDILDNVTDNSSSSNTNHHNERKGYGVHELSFWPSSGVIGLLLLFANLVMDGFTNSTQDVLVKKHNWSGNKLMVYVNVVSFAWTLAAMLFMELTAPHYLFWLQHLYSWLQSSSLMQSCLTYLPSLTYLHIHPIITPDLSFMFYFLSTFPDALRDVLLLVALNVCGQFFVFRTIALFGTLTLTTMTLLRKGGSVILSIVVHKHRVCLYQWMALLVVGVGVVCETIMNINERARRTGLLGKASHTNAPHIQAMLQNMNNKNNNNHNEDNDNNIIDSSLVNREHRPRRALENRHHHHANILREHNSEENTQQQQQEQQQSIEQQHEEENVIIKKRQKQQRKEQEQQHGQFGKKQNIQRNALNSTKFDKKARKQPFASVNKHSTAHASMKKKQ